MGSNLTLLASGCSFTDPELTKNNWVSQLADELDYIPLNVAESGFGNQAIFESIVEALSKYTVDLVIVQWTYLDRYDIEGGSWLRYHQYKWDKKGIKGVEYKQEEVYDIISTSFEKNTIQNVLETWQRKQDRYSFALKQICKSLNVKYIEFQGTDKWWPIEDNFKLVNKRLNIEFTEWSWDKHLKDLEGNGRDNPIYRVGYNQPSNWYVGYTGKLDFDWHPNELGHTVMKDILLERLNS